MKSIYCILATLLMLCTTLTAAENKQKSLSQLKAEMSQLQDELVLLHTQSSSLRANAGGAPTALKSANKGAKVTIGGDIKVRYNLGLHSNYNPTNSNARRGKGAWSIAECKLLFNIEFSESTNAFISFRPDSNGYAGQAGVGKTIDEAWWHWSDINGSALDIYAGLVKMSYGMYNSKLAPIGVYDGLARGIITDPFVQDFNEVNIYNTANPGLKTFLDNGARGDMGRVGAIAGYKWDQFALRAGVYGGGLGAGDQISDYGVTDTNSMRNAGIYNHTVSISFDPVLLEGLHIEASYMGRFDTGQGVDSYTNYPDNFLTAERRGASYNPSFIIGALYQFDEKLNIHAEANSVFNTEFWNNANIFAFTLGSDYQITEQIVLSGELDFATFDTANRFSDLNQPYNAVTGNLFRATFGARYDFGNGIALQAQYIHDYCSMTGVGDNNSKNDDKVILQTSFIF